ncbi:MAG: GH3 family domain-containing protein [Candidatus Helarchaeota archaeon]
MRFLELLGGLGAQAFKYYSNYSLKDPLKTQMNLLKEILRYHQTTLFGKKHNFHTVRSVRQFQRNCPPRSYEYFKPYIDKFIQGTRNALFNSNFLFFAQTSGTTGAPKLIPITHSTIRNYDFGVLRTISYYISENVRENSRIISGKWLYLPAPPLLRYVSGYPVGYITGLLMLPRGIQVWRYFLNYKSYAPIHLMHIKDTAEKFRRISRECQGKNITALVGVTPVIINLLDYLLKFTKASTIDQVFPNLQLAIFSGVSPKYYEARLTKIIGHSIAYREMYAASEGNLAVQLSKQPWLTPLYDSMFFEFIPVKTPSERLLIHQIRKGEEYHLIITTHNGLYAYDIGDTIKFVSEDPPAFIFSYRKNVIDLADEKLTPAQLFATINEVNTQMHCNIVDFCVIGVYDPRPHYIFSIEFLGRTRPEAPIQYLQSLDKTLEKINDIYFQNREGANRGTLASPELWILKKDTFIALEKQRIGEGAPNGQIKTTHMTKNKHLIELLETFVEKKFVILE